MSAARERRRYPRVEPVPGGPASHARLRASADLHVRDASAAGVCVEGPVRLLPGVHAELHLIGAAGRQLIRGRVVWARVRAVAPLSYEAALAFDAPLELLAGGYRLPCEGREPVEATERAYPPAGPPRTGVPEITGKSGTTAGGRLLGSDTAGGDHRDERRNERRDEGRAAR